MNLSFFRNFEKLLRMRMTGQLLGGSVLVLIRSILMTCQKIRKIAPLGAEMTLPVGTRVPVVIIISHVEAHFKLILARCARSRRAYKRLLDKVMCARKELRCVLYRVNATLGCVRGRRRRPRGKGFISSRIMGCEAKPSQR